MVEKAPSHESKIYHEMSHLYERIFTRFFGPRIQKTIRSLDIPPGAKVLEVGVGTGLSLPAYPEHAEVTAIDLAPDMLKQAQRKIDEHGWRHIELQEGNALDLEFPDEEFDYVVSFHVVSVAPDHEQMMREMTRVAKPGATIVLINHFRSERKWLAGAIDLLDPITRKFGWRTTLRFDEVFQPTPLRVERRYKDSWRSLFTIAIATKPKREDEPTPAADQS